MFLFLFGLAVGAAGGFFAAKKLAKKAEDKAGA